MRFCLYPGMLKAGGVGKNTLNLARKFIEAGHEVDLYLTKKEGDYLPQIPPKVNIYEGNGSALKSIFSFACFLRKTKPDAVISARDYLNITSFFSILLARTKTPQIATIRTSTKTDSNNRKQLFKLILKWLTTIIYPHIDQIVAVSTPVADDLAQYIGLSREKIKVIYNPVVTDTMIEKSRGASALTQEHPTFFSKPYFISIGRLSEEKDYITLLTAFKKINHNERYNLLILGDGEDRDKLTKYIETNDMNTSVLMPGFVSNPYPYLLKAAALISSSKWEGLPTVIIEALALGVNVIATDCPGGSSEILNNGEYGWLTPPGDATAMSQSIIKYIASPKEKSILINRSHDFTDTLSANKYIELIAKR